MKYGIEWSKDARKAMRDIGKSNPNMANKIIRALDDLAEHQRGDFRPMKGEIGVWRLVVGGFRVIYELLESDEEQKITGIVKIIFVVDLGPRGDIYK